MSHTVPNSFDNEIPRTTIFEFVITVIWSVSSCQSVVVYLPIDLSLRLIDVTLPYPTQRSQSKSPSFPLLQKQMANVAVSSEVPAWNLHGNDHLDPSSLSWVICAMSPELKVPGKNKTGVTDWSSEGSIYLILLLNWVCNWFAIQGTVRIAQSTAVNVPVRCLPAQHVILSSSLCLFVFLLSEQLVQYKHLLLDPIASQKTLNQVDCVLTLGMTVSKTRLTNA